MKKWRLREVRGISQVLTGSRRPHRVLQISPDKRQSWVKPRVGYRIRLL